VLFRSQLEIKIPPLKVANPMTREQEYLRTSLRPGLLAALAHNQKFEQAGVRLFEIGKVFLPQRHHVIATLGETKGKQSPEERELPQEKDMLCAVLGGARAELSWQADKEMLDFFDAKGAIENLLSQLGLKASFESSNDEGLYPGRGADVIVEDDEVGVVGDLHPRVAQAFELSNTVGLIEIDLAKLLTRIAGTGAYRSVPRFPSVSRDIALVIDEQASYRRVEEVIEDFPLVTKVSLFDLYRGEQVAEGKKSFAIRIAYQSPSRTLTDEEVDRTQEQMLARLHQELGATLRA
jgi:phenylalanyl-tRNA synthetase beta chain